MFHEYFLFLIMIYIFLYCAYDVFMQEVKNEKKLPFVFFCLFSVLFCILFIVLQINIDNTKILGYIYTIYNILFLFSMISLLYFSINIQDKITKVHKISAVLLFIIGLALSIGNTFFIINALIPLISIFFFLLKRLNSKQKKDIISSNMLIFFATVYTLITFFSSAFLNIFEKVYIQVVSSLFFALFIYYLIKNFDLMSLNISNFLLNLLSNSPEAVCIIGDSQIKYVNSTFYDMLSDNYKLPSKDARKLFPDDFFTDKEFSNKVFRLKKFNSPEYINILCNKVLLNQPSNIQNLEIITILDISIVQESQKEIEAINKNLEKIVQEQTKELEDINNELNNEIIKKIDSENKMLIASSTDPVTGLYNRRYFSQISHNIIVNSDINSDRHIVIYMDLDNFKNINDTLGHSVGDKVLKEVAKKISLSLPDSAIISRIGGDEFLVFIKNNAKEALSVIYLLAGSLLKNIRKPLMVDNNAVNLSTSIGFSIYPEAGKDIETLIKNADTAMYKAKENGKNSYFIFEKEINASVKRDFDLTNDMIMAIKNEEFKILYQPKMQYIDGKFKIVGLEAFVKWFHEKLGVINPDVFMPIAERSGYVSNIFLWTFTDVLKQIKIWNEKNMNFNVSINFPLQKSSKDGIYESLAKTLENSAINPEKLCFELDESYIAEDMEKSIMLLNFIKNLGIKVSIDNFGTKHSTLNFLRMLLINGIKISKIFVSGIGKNKKDEAIIISLIKLCCEIDIDICAEGVSTKQQCDFLLSHGLEKMQGPFFYNAMSVEEIEQIEMEMFN